MYIVSTYCLKILIFMLITVIPNFEASFLNGYIFASEQNDVNPNRLKKLIWYELDNIKLVELCLANVKTPSIRKKLMKMKEECENNRRDLETLKNSYDIDTSKDPSLQQTDPKGLFIDGSSVFRSGLMEKGALKILHDKMKIISNVYEETLKDIQSNEEKTTIQRILEGKKKFLQYLELCLSQCAVKEN